MQPDLCASVSKLCLPVIWVPSGNLQVGYAEIPAALHASVCDLPSGVEHSTNPLFSSKVNHESPNSDFCSLQCGHQKAPYIFVPESARHFANESDVSVFVQLATSNKIRNKKSFLSTCTTCCAACSLACTS